VIFADIPIDRRFTLPWALASSGSDRRRIVPVGRPSLTVLAAAVWELAARVADSAVVRCAKRAGACAPPRSLACYLRLIGKKSNSMRQGLSALFLTVIFP
jgi:hypothetical protein